MESKDIKVLRRFSVKCLTPTHETFFWSLQAAGV